MCNRNFQLDYLQFGFQKYLIYSLLIAYENDEWCRFLVHIGSPSLISFYWACFVSLYVFLFFLVINTTGLVKPIEPGSVCEKFWLHVTYTIFLEFLAGEYLRETNISILYLNYGFLLFRCLQKAFKEEGNNNKEGNSWVVTTSLNPWKVNFQGFNLVIFNFELPSAFLYALCELLHK